MTPAAVPEELRRRLDAAPMSRAQMRAVGLTVVLSALDGFDVLSVTFAAPAISRGWGIGKVELGVVLSSGLAGMALGSFLLAPLADLIGRKRLVLISLALMAAGSLLSASAGGVVALALWRVVTGLGIGACVAVINPLAAEFANARWRSFAVATMAMGYPAGGLVGALLAAALLRWSGWPAVFVAGGLAATVLIVVTAALLPESPAFLLGRGGVGLARLNTLLVRFGHAPVVALCAPAPRRRGYAGVFTTGTRATTARLGLVNTLCAAVIYYVLSWLPQLVGDAGFSPAQGSLVSATLSLVGIVGGLTLGALARRHAPERLTALAFAGLAIALALFGLVPARLPALVAGAGVLGFLIFGGSAGFYAVLARGFDDASRASGSGFVIGLGRVSSALAPLAAGWLFANGFGRGSVSAAFGVAALVAAGVLATHRSRPPEAA